MMSSGTATDGGLALEAIKFGYGRAGPMVLDDLSDRFPAGSVTTITGPSGCGKSTLLYILGLMIRPRSGNVLVGACSATSLSDSERSALRRERIGFVFQDGALDPARSVLDNVLESGVLLGISRRALVPVALELLEASGVTLDPFRKPGQVSGGQAARVGLCRALLKRPAILLADEPTGNLDRVTSALVMSMLRRTAAEGACVVVASHDAMVAEHSDRVLALGTSG